MKKDFKNNPALLFITDMEADREADPAEEQPQQRPQGAAKPPAGYKMDPRYTEKKTTRLQLVLQPSLMDRVRAAARASGLSVNEYCHRILDAATKE